VFLSGAAVACGFSPDARHLTGARLRPAAARMSGAAASAAAPRFGPLVLDPSQLLYETASTVVAAGLNPILPGHCVVLPRRPVGRLSELEPREVADLFESALRAQELVGPRVGATAFNLSVKDGLEAGQVVAHAHVHVVPRKPKDLESSDLVYGLLERWTPDPVRLPAPVPPPLELVPDELRVARDARAMAREADAYAAIAERVRAPREKTDSSSNGVSGASGARVSGDEDLRFSPKIRLDPGQVFMVSQSGLSLCLVNLKPLVPGHVLVIPRRVAPRYADLTAEERQDLWNTVREVQRVICAAYGAPASHLGLQDGPDSGQSVPHVHVHVLPAMAKRSNPALLEEPPDEGPERTERAEGTEGPEGSQGHGPRPRL